MPFGNADQMRNSVIWGQRQKFLEEITRTLINTVYFNICGQLVHVVVGLRSLRCTASTHLAIFCSHQPDSAESKIYQRSEN